MPLIRTPGADHILEIVVDPHFQGDLVMIARAHPVWIIDSDHNIPITERARATDRSEDRYEICRMSPSKQSPEQDLIDHMPTVYSHFNWSNPRYEYVVVQGTPVTDAIKIQLEETYGFTIVESHSDGFTARVHPDPNFNTMDFTGLPPNPAVVARQSKQGKK